MNIALLGYGRMGKAIEAIAKERGHSVVVKIESHQDIIDFKNADVAIDFSLPSSAVHNISLCLNAHIPVISGTTGWLEHYDDIVRLCNDTNGTFLYASNFSLGVNVFFEVNKTLAKLIGKFPEYKTTIEEIHHTQKLDAPSGTAITLAEAIIAQSSYDNWSLDATRSNEIGINAKRIKDVPGTHEINYDSDIDSIQIKHTAHNRKGFALGAVIAAEYIKDKKGVLTMKDVLNIS